jgi:hypothetical protein
VVDSRARSGPAMRHRVGQGPMRLAGSIGQGAEPGEAGAGAAKGADRGRQMDLGGDKWTEASHHSRPLARASLKGITAFKGL